MWGAYRAKRGSLNTGMRTEVAIARFCALWANYTLRRNGDPLFHLQDFAPHMDAREITLEELAAQMGAI